MPEPKSESVPAVAVPPLVLIVREEKAGLALEDALTEAGFRTLRAGTVSGAIQGCMEQSPDLTIVDVELPQEPGLALLQFFRQLGTERHVPVLLIAAGDDEAQRIDAFAQGCDDFLPPAVSVQELVARTRRHLELGHRIDGLLAEQERLRALSVSDGLTGLANHRAFQERLNEEFRRAQRYDDPLAVIMLDLDHFKAVNDQFGHQTGDDVLKAVAECMRQCVRETDFVARYGGEEFAALLPKTHLAGALTVAERVSTDLRRARMGPRQLVSVTASFGLSTFPGRNVTTPDQLLRTADEALYRAKREGRNKISLHHASVLTAREGLA